MLAPLADEVCSSVGGYSVNVRGPSSEDAVRSFFPPFFFLFFLPFSRFLPVDPRKSVINGRGTA